MHPMLPYTSLSIDSLSALIPRADPVQGLDRQKIGGVSVEGEEQTP